MSVVLLGFATIKMVMTNKPTYSLVRVLRPHLVVVALLALQACDATSHGPREHPRFGVSVTASNDLEVALVSCDDSEQPVTGRVELFGEKDATTTRSQLLRFEANDRVEIPSRFSALHPPAELKLDPRYNPIASASDLPDFVDVFVMFWGSTEVDLRVLRAHRDEFFYRDAWFTAAAISRAKC